MHKSRRRFNARTFYFLRKFFRTFPGVFFFFSFCICVWKSWVISGVYLPIWANKVRMWPETGRRRPGAKRKGRGEAGKKDEGDACFFFSAIPGRFRELVSSSSWKIRRENFTGGLPVRTGTNIYEGLKICYIAPCAGKWRVLLVQHRDIKHII